MSESPRELVPQRPEQTPTTSSAPIAGVGLTRGRKIAALVIASVSDAISVAAQFTPPIQIGIDIATAIALFVVLGFRWPLLPVLVVEAVPGLATFPTWMLVVGVMVGVTPTAKS